LLFVYLIMTQDCLIRKPQQNRDKEGKLKILIIQERLTSKNMASSPQ
jgi:hypothetical protein